jgi:hypothetical protein
VLIAAGLVAVAAAAAYQMRDRFLPAPEQSLVALTPPKGKTPTAHDSSKLDGRSAAKTPATSDAASSKSGRVPSPSTTTSTTAPTTADAGSRAKTDESAMHGTDPLADAHASAPTADTTATSDSNTTDATTHGAQALLASADTDVDAAHSSTSRPAADRIESWLLAQRGPEIPGSDLGMSPHTRMPFTSAIEDAPISPTGAASDRAPNFGMSRSPLTNPGAPIAGVEGSPQPLLRTRASTDHASRTASGGLRHATAEDLAGVWEGSVIPMDSIGAPSRLLTPGVGRVRVVIQRGEIFEGRLYAVGQGKVWLDTGTGRLALLSDQVQRIEHLTSPSGTPGLGAPGSQELAGLPRVRVHTPGGTFYGKVISRDDTTVTLITDQGARVMLETRDVESAPVGVKSVLVKPQAKH